MTRNHRETGTEKAYRALQNIAEEPVMDEFLWDTEVADFIDVIRQAGIETFVYTNQPTFENLHAFAANGCTKIGYRTITRKEIYRGEEETYEVEGIRFKLN